MLSCAFFGHRDYDYLPYEGKIREVVIDLINSGVTEFYNGYRGNFDKICARIVSELREQYPHIKNINVLSYYPKTSFVLPKYFDNAVYLLERKVAPRYAIVHTNKELVKKVNFVVSGVVHAHGGAKIACDYAKKQLRSMINVVTDEELFFNRKLLTEIENMVQEYRERLENDVEYRETEEEKNRKIYERVAPILDKHAKKVK